MGQVLSECVQTCLMLVLSRLIKLYKLKDESKSW